MISQLSMFTWADLTYVLPVTSSTYALTAIVSKFVLGEQVSLARWIGIGIVTLGVVLVSETAPNTKRGGTDHNVKWVWLLISITTSAVGDLMSAKGMAAHGDIQDFGVLGLSRILRYIATQRLVVLGILFQRNFIFCAYGAAFCGTGQFCCSSGCRQLRHQGGIGSFLSR